MREKASPFGALIAASSFIAAILYVAGFAYRWSYYYNFGLQHVVYEFGFPVILMTAIELIRTPEHLWLFLVWVAFPLIVVSVLIGLLGQGARALIGLLEQGGRARLARVATSALRMVGLDSPLVADTIRALVLIYTTYMVSSHLGYLTYRSHVVDSSDNPLPTATVVFDRKEGEPMAPLACGTESRETPVIGDARKLRQIQDGYRTCTGRGIAWRLLYRNSNVIFLFASEPKEVITDARPLTVVLPVTASIQLILQ